MNKSILIVEDEEAIFDILSYSLRQEGYAVKGAATGHEARRLLQGTRFDLVILDVMLPDTTGFELCKEITASTSLPILMLTARGDIVDKVLGLELGADDYLTKPFDIREVLARVKALLRRQKQDATYQYIPLDHDIIMNPSAHTVLKKNETVALKPKEFELLLLFAQHPNRVFSREEILDHVWSFDYSGGDRTVDVHVQRIRQKLHPALIETVFGAGYRMRRHHR
ncbi:response regulator transcription factor [Jeotgalibacillus aurantiacus]|uniref:response regulator transcription factor n=1 Tax=Jeotgalibacillus aurantiacus TaxID=2763266 RepID=UPI001D0B6857|nr:response regulator transcription factor [Jeotgalibacillus aurantiacus]